MTGPGRDSALCEPMTVGTRSALLFSSEQTTEKVISDGGSTVMYVISGAHKSALRSTALPFEDSCRLTFELLNPCQTENCERSKWREKQIYDMRLQPIMVGR